MTHDFFQIKEIKSCDLEAGGDQLREIFDGAANGLLIREAFDPAELAHVVARLESDNHGFEKTLFPAEFKAGFYGLGLDMSEGDLARYAKSASAFRSRCRKTFRGGRDFEERTIALCRMMSGGRAVRVPTFSDGSPYTPATIRWLPPGGFIRTHCGNECMTRAGYNHLNGLIDLTNQLSYFLTIRPADAGGELVIYDQTFESLDPAFIEHGHTNVEDQIESYASIKVRPNVGDIVIFDGGRYLHRVNHVVGEKTRWTIGGFVGFSKCGSATLLWN